MGEGGGGEELLQLSPFFASIFPLFPRNAWYSGYVLYDFDILSMIKRKNPFGFYCAILILNLSRLISLITILISKVRCVWFLKCMVDFQNLTRLISKVCRVWFLKWHFWFPKFIAFDFSNNTFDFQNLSRLISRMTLSISKIYRVWFLKWRFPFPKFVVFDFSLKKITLSISKMRQIWMIFTQQFCGW